MASPLSISQPQTHTFTTSLPANTPSPSIQAVTKRAGRNKAAAAGAAGAGGGAGAKPQVRKAVFESTKKKEVGVSDLTLISKISNEAINENLQKRFANGEIYVGDWRGCACWMRREDTQRPRC